MEVHLKEVNRLAQHFDGVMGSDCPRFGSRREWTTYFDDEIERVVLLVAHLEQAWYEATRTGDDDVRIRGWAGLDGAIEGYAPAGAVLLVLGGPELDDAGNAWYPVDYDGLSGYTNADFLSWTGQGLSART